jgi:hypothetical protein
MHKKRKSKSKSKASEKMSEVVISNEAKELAEAIISLKDEKENERQISLPIEMIDGVYTESEIVLHNKNNGILFRIQTKWLNNNGEQDDIYHYSKWNTDGLTDNEIETFCQEVFDKIPLLKLTHEGVLRANKSKHDIAREKVDAIFRNFNCDNIKKSCSDECCVCYNKTLTKTQCNHSLCRRCWSKMYNDIDCDDEDVCEVKCPLCRADVV